MPPKMQPSECLWLRPLPMVALAARMENGVGRGKRGSDAPLSAHGAGEWHGGGRGLTGRVRLVVRRGAVLAEPSVDGSLLAKPVVKHCCHADLAESS